MALGLQEAARLAGCRIDVRLAVEQDPEVAEIYRRNISSSVTVQDAAALFDGMLGESPTPSERCVTDEIGPIQLLQGGPPCQGHSDLNNHTRRNDPKNSLYLTMVRAAEILHPDVVIIENVATVRWDRSRVVDTAFFVLEANGYKVSGRVLDLWKAGVPQLRRRFVLLASKRRDIDPSLVLDSLAATWGNHPPRTVRWAIGDLLHVDANSAFDTPSKKSKPNAKRMAFLFERGLYDLPDSERPDCHKDGDHSYVSVYGRLRWDRPAQTITTGFGSMGQGRYVHPQRRRTLTPHEAARLQTFPDSFDFGKHSGRGVLAKSIGNAVPPLLMLRLGEQLLPKLFEKQAEQFELKSA